MTPTQLNADTLRHAFDEFNQQSSLLEASYRALQDQVAVLTAELQESQSARHRQLLEKERLNSKLSRILETVPGAIIVLDGEGIVRERNDVAVDWLHRPLLGRAWSEIARREFRAKRNADGELRLRSGRLLSFARQSLRSEPGEILLLTDITESRETAELLNREQRLSAIGEMTARLAHQIRTPLASALLYASQLGSESESRTGQLAARLTERLNELGRMVNDMLHYASGVRDADEEIDVGALLQSIRESLLPQITDGGEISVVIGSESLRVCGNRDALKAAILNLANNALQATGSAASIEIVAFTTGKHLCLSVSDNGKGVPIELRERIFEPFFTTRPQGTGLGLAVVRSIAQAHGGDVSLQSDASGATFCISLPLPTSATAGGDASSESGPSLAECA